MDVMGGLSNIFSTAERGSGLGGALKAMAGDLTADASRMGGILPGGMSTSAAPPGPPANLPPGFVDKLLYLAVLRGAIQRATEAPHFSLEAHINDLWTKLGQVRDHRAESDQLQQMIAKRTDLLNTMRQIVDRYSDTAKGVIQGIR
jgi:hypothetical protein